MNWAPRIVATRWKAPVTTRGPSLNFADGHTAFFPYSYICAQGGSRPGDPGRPDINWTFNGQPVP